MSAYPDFSGFRSITRELASLRATLPHSTVPAPVRTRPRLPDDALPTWQLATTLIAGTIALAALWMLPLLQTIT